MCICLGSVSHCKMLRVLKTKCNFKSRSLEHSIFLIFDHQNFLKTVILKFDVTNNYTTFKILMYGILLSKHKILLLQVTQFIPTESLFSQILNIHYFICPHIFFLLIFDSVIHCYNHLFVHIFHYIDTFSLLCLLTHKAPILGKSNNPYSLCCLQTA